MLKLSYLYLSLFFFSHFCFSEASITINHRDFVFTNQPRLSEVLSKVADEKDWYWPTSRLFRVNSNEANKLREMTISNLQFAQLTASQNDAANFTKLISQIQNWHLADRILIKIDFDLAQVDPRYNPRFEDGSYRLDLSTRSPYLTIFGLTDLPRVIKTNKKQCSSELVSELFLQQENKDYIYIVQPDGLSLKVGIAYWNAECVDIMPGSQIFLPLPESQFSIENTELNRQIIQLAKNRILP